MIRISPRFEQRFAQSDRDWETTTTPDVIDQNAIYAKIMVKPVKSIEFIAIDFVIASQGASFDD